MRYGDINSAKQSICRKGEAEWKHLYGIYLTTSSKIKNNMSKTILVQWYDVNSENT